jgi:hypothetical protein
MKIILLHAYIHRKHQHATNHNHATQHSDNHSSMQIWLDALLYPATQSLEICVLVMISVFAPRILDPGGVL